jgi:hydrogenase nickel incorporation protein HypA/HybF
MHELPVTESILEIALRHAIQADAKRITELNLVIGQLSSIIDDSIQFYWDIIAKDTIAEGATLNFKRIPTQMTCQECHTAFSPQEDDFACPNCQSQQVKVTAGDEFFLESIQIDT